MSSATHATPHDVPVVRPSRPDQRARLALAGFVLLVLTNPLLWQPRLPGPWFPPAGLAILLMAWLGPQAIALVAGAGLLVVATAWTHGAALSLGPLPLWDALLAGPEAFVAWQLYLRGARGSRRLADPRSAVLFLLLVPGLVTGLGAAVRAFAAGPAEFGPTAVMFWSCRALGVLAVAPPLLAAATPWLLRRGWVTPERPGEFRARELPERLRLGDRLEILGLAVGTATLSVLLVLAQQKPVVGWQLWVLPLLLIVWTSLRQGLRGGTAVAAASAVTALTFVACLDPTDTLSPLQGYLLAQTSTALLVGASFSWLHVSEARHRQVVEGIPVVLYSVRLLEPPGPRGRPEAADVTFVSPGCRALYGCDPEAMLGKLDAWISRVHLEDRELLHAAVIQVCRTVRPVTCEYRLAEGDGHPAVPSPRHPVTPSPRWVRDNLVPTLDADGQLAGWDGVIEDITEQRTLAHDLRRNTGMLHTLVAHLPAGVFFVQAPGGRPVHVNARARKLLGQREDVSAVLAQWPEVYRLYRPDGTPYPADELPVAVALRRGVPCMRDDIVVHRPDGLRVPLVTWAAPLDLGGRGQYDAAVWVLEDLTALQQAEAARRESEARLRSVIEMMAEGVEVYDSQGVLVDYNRAVCAVHGCGPDDLRGRTTAEHAAHFVREDGSPLPAAEHPAARCLRDGQPVRDVVLGMPRAGGMTWLQMSCVPFTEGRSQVPARVVVTFTDVTTQRRALAVSRESEEKYRTLLETLPVAVLQSDLDMRVVYANPATKEVTGYDLTEIETPAAWQPLLDQGDLPKVFAARQRALEGETVRLELNYRVPDGAMRTGYTVMQPWRQGEVIVGTTTVVMDVTAQRLLEQELQRNQRLELAGRLASGLVHDFNNLLTVILSMTELACQHLPQEHPTRADLDQVKEAASQAARLAAQLLTFSKQRRLAPRPVDLNGVVRRTLDLLRGTLPPGIELAAALDPNNPYTLAEEVPLQQVLINLCLNARDAMPRGGRLGVTTEVLPGAGENGTGWVRLSVQDNGEGISEQMRGRIFDPFFSTKASGTGLGLAVVRQIVTGFGGRVEVQSQPGAGARFDVCLPLVRK